MKCKKCGRKLIKESIQTYHHNQNGEPLYLDVLVCPKCDYFDKEKGE